MKTKTRLAVALVSLCVAFGSLSQTLKAEDLRVAITFKFKNQGKQEFVGVSPGKVGTGTVEFTVNPSEALPLTAAKNPVGEFVKLTNASCVAFESEAIRDFQGKVGSFTFEKSDLHAGGSELRSAEGKDCAPLVVFFDQAFAPGGSPKVAIVLARLEALMLSTSSMDFANELSVASFKPGKNVIESADDSGGGELFDLAVSIKHP